MSGIVPTISAEMTEDFLIFMSWVNSFKKMKVRTNADNPKDIPSCFRSSVPKGLCRTEHMFLIQKELFW